MFSSVNSSHFFYSLLRAHTNFKRVRSRLLNFQAILGRATRAHTSCVSYVRDRSTSIHTSCPRVGSNTSEPISEPNMSNISYVHTTFEIDRSIETSSIHPYFVSSGRFYHVRTNFRTKICPTDLSSSLCSHVLRGGSGLSLLRKAIQESWLFGPAALLLLIERK